MADEQGEHEPSIFIKARFTMGRFDVEVSTDGNIWLWLGVYGGDPVVFLSQQELESLQHIIGEALNFLKTRRVSW